MHHGYERLTDDVDVLVELPSPERLDEHLATHGFTREAVDRLRHDATGVAVDLLISGEPMPRPGCPPYPPIDKVEPSPADPDFAALRPLVELKLYAHRHQDVADIVELLKRMDETRYDQLEAAAAPALRRELAALRRDALEELSYEEGARGGPASWGK